MIAKCKLCSAELHADHDGVLDGKAEQRAHDRLGKMMAIHMNSMHQPELIAIAESSATFSGWLLMTHFECDDKLYTEQLAAVRQHVVDLVTPGAVQRPGQA